MPSWVWVGGGSLSAVGHFQALVTLPSPLRGPYQQNFSRKVRAANQGGFEEGEILRIKQSPLQGAGDAVGELRRALCAQLQEAFSRERG